LASTLIRAASAAGLAALLAACAATPQTSRFSDELARLEQDCTARGGVLTPVAAASSRSKASTCGPKGATQFESNASNRYSRDAGDMSGGER